MRVTVSSLLTFSFVGLVFPCFLFIFCLFLLRYLPTYCLPLSWFITGYHLTEL